MIFKETFQKLEQSENPVAQSIHKTETSQVLTIVFKKGMLLKSHKTTIPAKLLVIKGQVIYREAALETTLALYEEKEIPVEVLHSVEALEDSICLLFKG